mmetsp:Transcript_7/g.12  ORF Transcript_7/g.12 Transcript_7/m.12 type:complete len:104 (-) Transcript_7:1632-1943(-)
MDVYYISVSVKLCFSCVDEQHPGIPALSKIYHIVHYSATILLHYTYVYLKRTAIRRYQATTSCGVSSVCFEASRRKRPKAVPSQVYELNTMSTPKSRLSSTSS